MSSSLGKAVAVAIGSLALVAFIAGGLLISITEDPTIHVTAPGNWDSSYTENYENYAIVQSYAKTDWSTVEATESWQSVTTQASMQTQYNAIPAKLYMTQDDIDIALLSENEAWEFISNGLFKEYPTRQFITYQKVLEELRKTNTETITVYVWYWSNPDDIYNMDKVTRKLTLAVNSALAPTFKHIFADIYADESQPVFNLADTGMGTWVLRGKNHNNNNTMSAHSLGCAIDINPSTGSFKVDGNWYGNAYGQKRMSYSMWTQLPECHAKYHVLYDGCPIVEVFKSYGFYWGGDWSDTKDCMHLSYIGDGSHARETGIDNYLERR